MTTTNDVQGRPIGGAANPAARTQTSGSLTAGQGADFSTFLKMLTTQMQNQNPLNPIEASDFAVQLATFSGVEQQVQTNQLLSRLTERLLQDDMSTWLGSEVAGSGAVHIAAAPVTLSLPAPRQEATRRDLVLQTDTGREVLRIPLDLQQNIARIDPDADGATPLLSGPYVAKVEEFRGSELVQTQNALQFSAVQEVRQQASGIVLVLSSGDSLPAADVKAVRQPSAR